MELEVIKKRKEKDLQVTISVTTGGQYVSLVGRDLRLVMRTPLNKEVSPPFEIVDGYKVRFNFRGKLCGIHSFTVYENRGKNGATAVDSTRVIDIVPRSYMENDAEPEGLDVECIDLGIANLEVGTGGEGGGSCNITIDQQLNTESFNAIANAPVARQFEAMQKLISDLTERLETLEGGEVRPSLPQVLYGGGAEAVFDGVLSGGNADTIFLEENILLGGNAILN